MDYRDDLILELEPQPVDVYEYTGYGSGGDTQPEYQRNDYDQDDEIRYESDQPSSEVNTSS